VQRQLAVFIAAMVFAQATLGCCWQYVQAGALVDPSRSELTQSTCPCHCLPEDGDGDNGLPADDQCDHQCAGVSTYLPVEKSSVDQILDATLLWAILPARTADVFDFTPAHWQLEVDLIATDAVPLHLLFQVMLI